MQPLLKRITNLSAQIDAAFERLAISDKQKTIETLEGELATSEIWNNPAEAQDKSKQLAALTNMVEPWVTLQAQVSDMSELIAMNDDSLLREFDGQVTALEKEFDVRRKELLLNGEYDDHNAILRLSAGVGGTDAQDWTEMIERMYLRWAEKSGMKTSIVERSTGEEAGIKSSVIEVTGPYSYGKLKSEHGVHRLV